MTNAAQENPPVDFRQQEIARLFEKIRAGESASVIGISNIGKSNLIQEMLDPQVQRCFLEEAENFAFLRVNFHNLPDFSNRSVYSLILEQLEMLDVDGNHALFSEDELRQIDAYHEALLLAGRDELRIQRAFKRSLRIFFSRPGRRLVLLFDQFDRLYQQAASQMFYNLRGLRDTYKYRISYLVFTSQPLPDIEMPSADAPELQKEDAEADGEPYAPHPEPAREEFFELLQPNQFYLQPYTPEDARLLLRRVALRHGIPFDEDASPALIQLTGGHAGLLRVCYLHLNESGAQPSPDKSGLQALLDVESILQECDRVWTSLNESEQDVLVARARNISLRYVEKSTEQKLARKGILTAEGSIFSPLFEQYVRKKKSRLDRPVYLNEKRHWFYVRRKPVQNLSKSEYLFLKKLYDRENTVVSHEELFRALYPNEEFDQVHSPQSLSTIAYRVRQKLGLPEKDKLLEARTKQGYILNNQASAEQE